MGVHSAPATPLLGTDISKITRKPSKTGKHGHEKRRSTREAKDSKPKSKKVNYGVRKTIQGLTYTMAGRNKSNQELLIGSLKYEGHVDVEKAQMKMDLYYNHSHNKHKGLNKDCQLGNPCEMKSDPRAKNQAPMIG
ncbi:hypothetical protein Tco_0247854 [Tanacetum coccineum]